MTRIIFIFNPEFFGTYIIDDPRSPRELVAAINTGKYRVAEGMLKMDGLLQWAMIHPPMEVITVVLEPPPIALTPRMYDVLFGLADGKTAGQIAKELGITARTVYAVTTEIKERFGVATRDEVIVNAYDLGLID